MDVIASGGNINKTLKLLGKIVDGGHRREARRQKRAQGRIDAQQQFSFHRCMIGIHDIGDLYSVNLTPPGVVTVVYLRPLDACGPCAGRETASCIILLNEKKIDIP